MEGKARILKFLQNKGANDPDFCENIIQEAKKRLQKEQENG